MFINNLLTIIAKVIGETKERPSTLGMTIAIWNNNFPPRRTFNPFCLSSQFFRFSALPLFRFSTFHDFMIFTLIYTFVARYKWKWKLGVLPIDLSWDANRSNVIRQLTRFWLWSEEAKKAAAGGGKAINTEGPRKRSVRSSSTIGPNLTQYQANFQKTIKCFKISILGILNLNNTILRIVFSVTFSIKIEFFQRTTLASFWFGKMGDKWK